MAKQSRHSKKSLSESHPHIASQANGWDPQFVSHGSDLVLEWRCSEGHVKKARVANHVKRGGKCQVCLGRSAVPGFNDLATTNPVLASELVDVDPLTLTSKSTKKVKWRCKQLHEWSTRVSHRVNGSGCPYCAGQRAIPGENDLLTVAPNIAREAIGWDPQTVSAHSDFVGEWECSVGHHWRAAVKKRARGDGCPYCSGHRLLVGFNDLEARFPSIAQQLVDLDPKSIYYSSTKKVSWRCSKGHIWLATPQVRIKGRGCPYCSNNSLMIGFNDLATTHPDLAAEAYNWDPGSVIGASGSKLEWRCQTGHIWKASVNNRLKNSGCPYCSGRLPILGETDLQTTHPELANEAVGWSPLLVKAGTNSRRRWRCQSGHEWVASIASRALRGSGCPSCATFGFSPSSKAWIYLFDHDRNGLLQVGITNDPKTRIATHVRAGWTLLEIYGPVPGDLAQNLESQIINLLRRSGAIMRNKRGEFRESKRTEAWVRNSFPITSLKELLKLVRDGAS